VVPISITGSGQVLPKKALSPNPGIIRVHYGEPIDLNGMSLEDRDVLMDRVRLAIVANKAHLDEQAS
jgi:1-acyl-sn-glycerol-3-phosphate acyltransferase